MKETELYSNEDDDDKYMNSLLILHVNIGTIGQEELGRLYILAVHGNVVQGSLVVLYGIHIGTWKKIYTAEYEWRELGHYLYNFIPMNFIHKMQGTCFT